MKFEVEWKGDLYDFEWFDDTDFENLDNVKQSYGFCFDNEGKICIVNVHHQDDRWCLPGGGPEDYDANYEATLIREVDEEADLDIKDIKRIGYMEVIPHKDRSVFHNCLRYVAKIGKVKEQTEDPAHDRVPWRKFVSPEEFNNVLNWGKSGEIQLKKALEAMNGKE